MRTRIPTVARQIVLLSLSFTAWGTDFSFFTTIRAGYPTPLLWELGAGSTSSTSESNVNYEWNTANGDTSWRPGNLQQSFQVGYNRTTNTGFVTVFNSNNTPVTASYTNPGAAPAVHAIWTLPSANFFASAQTSFLPGSIDLENLSFDPGVQILSGSLPTSIGASNPGNANTITSNINAPIIFDAIANGGNWTISGTVRMNGIVGTSGSALGNNLLFQVGAFGSDTPESSTISLFGAGLAAILLARRCQRI